MMSYMQKTPQSTSPPKDFDFHHHRANIVSTIMSHAHQLSGSTPALVTQYDEVCHSLWLCTHSKLLISSPPSSILPTPETTLHVLLCRGGAPSHTGCGQHCSGERERQQDDSPGHHHCLTAEKLRTSRTIEIRVVCIAGSSHKLFVIVIYTLYQEHS